MSPASLLVFFPISMFPLLRGVLLSYWCWCSIPMHYANAWEWYDDALIWWMMSMIWWMIRWMLLPMRIHHCWWTMPMTDTTNQAEIWCGCSDLMNAVNDIVNDTTNDAATWCRFTIADERWQRLMRWMKLRFDADALFWWMMSMILWMIRRMMLLFDAHAPLLMNDANDRYNE